MCIILPPKSKPKPDSGKAVPNENHPKPQITGRIKIHPARPPSLSITIPFSGSTSKLPADLLLWQTIMAQSQGNRNSTLNGPATHGANEGTVAEKREGIFVRRGSELVENVENVMSLGRRLSQACRRGSRTLAPSSSGAAIGVSDKEGEKEKEEVTKKEREGRTRELELELELSRERRKDLEVSRLGAMESRVSGLERDRNLRELERSVRDGVERGVRSAMGSPASASAFASSAGRLGVAGNCVDGGRCPSTRHLGRAEPQEKIHWHVHRDFRERENYRGDGHRCGDGWHRWSGDGEGHGIGEGRRRSSLIGIPAGLAKKVLDRWGRVEVERDFLMKGAREERMREFM